MWSRELNLGTTADQLTGESMQAIALNFLPVLTRNFRITIYAVPFRGNEAYPLATVLAIATAAKLAGYHGVTAFAEFAQALSQEQLRALRAYYSHRLERFTAPTVTTFHNILTALDPDVLDRAVRTWAAQRSAGEEPVAIDGKSIRGAARQNPDGQHLLVAAAEHCCGLVLGQEAVPDKSNEIPAVRTLTSGLALAGRVVTLDALHTQDHTARHLEENCQANYVMAAVKSNRLALLADLAALDWERPEVRATEHRTEDKRHGRLEKRSCRIIDLTTDAHAGKAKLPHRRVAFRIERERRHRKTSVVQHETAHGLSSLPFEHASAERILALVRGRWGIHDAKASKTKNGRVATANNAGDSRGPFVALHRRQCTLIL